MIQEYNKFTCNECEKEELILKELGYPYEKGWRRIHNMMGKVSREVGDPSIFEVKDIDCCSDNCEVSYLTQQMAKSIEKIILPPLPKQFLNPKKKSDVVVPKEIVKNGVDTALESMEQI